MKEKSNMKKSFWSFLILTVLIASFYMPSFAEDLEKASNYSPQASLYIDSFDGIITANPGQKIEVLSTVTGTGIMDVIGVSTLNIQEYRSGSWVTVKSWSSLYKYNSIQASFLTTYQGVAGRKYRAVITFYAANSRGSDTKSLTTTSIMATK
jgi:hypothetical protein